MRQDDGEEERTGGIVGKADTPGPRITHTTNRNWAHYFQEMTGVLIDAGLTIRALGEHDISDRRPFPCWSTTGIARVGSCLVAFPGFP